MIYAQWFGGPWDGKVFGFPDNTHDVRVPLFNLSDVTQVEPSCELNPIRYTTCVLRRTEHGFIIVWKEPK